MHALLASNTVWDATFGPRLSGDRVTGLGGDCSGDWAAFVREHKINLSRIEYLAGRVLDESLRSAFDAFHKEHARLRIVSATANLSDLRKGRC